jgi:hypothetical protein
MDEESAMEYLKSVATDFRFISAAGIGFYLTQKLDVFGLFTAEQKLSDN